MYHTIKLLTMMGLDGSVVIDQLAGCSITCTMLHQPTLPLYGGCKGRLIGQKHIVKITDIGYMGSGDLHDACQ